MQYYDEKQMIEERIAWIDKLLKKHEKRGGPGEVNSDTSYVDADAIRVSHRQSAESYFITWQELCAERNALYERLARLNQRIDSIRAYVESEPDSRKRVFYIKNYIDKDMPLRQVAELAGISYDRCKHISMEIKRENDTKNDTDSIEKTCYNLNKEKGQQNSQQ